MLKFILLVSVLVGVSAQSFSQQQESPYFIPDDKSFNLSFVIPPKTDSDSFCNWVKRRTILLLMDMQVFDGAVDCEPITKKSISIEVNMTVPVLANANDPSAEMGNWSEYGFSVDDFCYPGRDIAAAMISEMSSRHGRIDYADHCSGDTNSKGSFTIMGQYLMKK